MEEEKGYGSIGSLRSNLATMLAVAYVVVGSYILLNLLVAMMATTFGTVYSNNRDEFIFQRSFTTVRYAGAR